MKKNEDEGTMLSFIPAFFMSEFSYLVKETNTFLWYIIKKSALYSNHVCEFLFEKKRHKRI